MPAALNRSHADLFLKITTATGGVMKGESADNGIVGKHAGEIEVMSWSWGMEAPTDAASGKASGKRQFKRLRIVKNVDLASPALMSALSNNANIKEAILTARNSAPGGAHVEFLVIKISNGRIVKYDIEYPDPDTRAAREVVEFAYQKIDITYTPQGSDKEKQGVTQFMDEWMPPS